MRATLDDFEKAEALNRKLTALLETLLEGIKVRLVNNDNYEIKTVLAVLEDQVLTIKFCGETFKIQPQLSFVNFKMKIVCFKRLSFPTEHFEETASLDVSDDGWLVRPNRGEYWDPNRHCLSALLYLMTGEDNESRSVSDHY